MLVAAGAACTEASDDGDRDGETAQPLVGEVSLFTAKDIPAVLADPDSNAVELGMRFRADAAGSIRGIRFYKSVTNNGPHVAHLWSNDGALLATANFTGETASGWQTARFGSAVTIAAGKTYVASYYTSRGHYSATNGGFARSIDRGPLHGLRDGEDGRNGVYRYGSSGFPNRTWKSTNYFVDVLFSPTTGGTSDPGESPPPSPPPDGGAPPPPPPDSGVPSPPTTFPNADNTGVPAGTTLTAYTGPLTITAANTVIDAKKISGCVVIRADNVTIKNSLIQSGGCFFNVLSDNGNTGLKLIDVEIDGLKNLSGDSAIAGSNYTCQRCNLHGTVDGAKAGNSVVFEDSYIHDLAMSADSHNDGIQSLGTNSLRIVHNTIIVGNGSTSAIILSTGSADSMRNILIHDNLLGGGAYTVYGGYAAGRDALSKVSNISVTNNQFTTQIFPKSGAYGAMTSVDSPVVVSGNVWFDGPNKGKAAF